MTLWWIGNVVLLVVVLPVVVYLLRGVLNAATSDRPERPADRDGGGSGVEDLDAAALLLTTQDQVEQTVAGVANYGGSLDVILDDAKLDGWIAATAVGVVTILAVVLIVLALVYYLVSVILELRRITNGLDEVIASVGEIVEKSAPVNEVVTGINAQLDAGVDLLEGLLVKKAGLTDAVGLVEGLYAGRRRSRVQELPGEHDDRRRRGSARSTRRARSRSPGWAARRRSQPGTRRVPRCGTSSAEASPRACSTPRSARRVPSPCPDRRSSAPTRPSSTSSGTTSGHRASGSRAAPPERERSLVQTPAPFEYERATSVEGAIASLQRLGPDARVIAGGHSLLPMMKLRLANPAHLIDINDLKELSYIREEGDEVADRRADPPRRAAEVGAARRAPAALPRRRERDRRPGRAQPRHDRRLALPGGRRRGPLGRLLGGEGEGRDPRRRRRARGRDGGLPRRPVHDRGAATASC